MEQWPWVIAGVAIVTLVQLLAYYYFAGGRSGTALPASSDGDPAAPQVGDGPSAVVPDPGSEGGSTEVRRCGECGAPNDADPVYQYCQYCGGPLS